MLCSPCVCCDDPEDLRMVEGDVLSECRKGNSFFLFGEDVIKNNALLTDILTECDMTQSKKLKSL